MGHGQSGEGEVSPDFFFDASIEEIDRSMAYQYNMYGGGVPTGPQDHQLPTAEPAAPPPKARKKQVKEKRVAHRGSAFTKEEDTTLCDAFLNVGKDPATGVNQNLDSYYKRMYDYYNGKKPKDSVRSQISLQKRWAAIQKAVSKFCSFKSTVDRRNESGKNEYDRIDDAVKMYEQTEPFHFMHCWKMLRDEPKWNDKLLELNSSAGGGKAAAAAAPASMSRQSNDNAQVERPEGRDSAKRRRAKEDAASSSTAVEVLQQINERNKVSEGKQDEQMQEILNMKGNKVELTQKMYELQKHDVEVRSKYKEEQLSLTKQDIEVRAKQSEAQLLTAEVGIMGADLSKLSASVRSYYLLMQRQIMERRGVTNPENNDDA